LGPAPIGGYRWRRRHPRALPHLILGGHLATSLARGAFDLAVQDRDQARAEPLRALGAAVAESRRGREGP
jgi:hypothetical protein